MSRALCPAGHSRQPGRCSLSGSRQTHPFSTIVHSLLPLAHSLASSTLLPLFTNVFLTPSIQRYPSNHFNIHHLFISPSALTSCARTTSKLEYLLNSSRLSHHRCSNPLIFIPDSISSRFPCAMLLKPFISNKFNLLLTSALINHISFPYSTVGTTNPHTNLTSLAHLTFYTSTHPSSPTTPYTLHSHYRSPTFSRLLPQPHASPGI